VNVSNVVYFSRELLKADALDVGIKDTRKRYAMTYLVNILGMNYHTLKSRVQSIGVDIINNRGEKSYVMISDRQLTFLKIPVCQRTENTRDQLETCFDAFNLAFSGKKFPAYGHEFKEISGNKKIYKHRM
jgi:hypothetical protein